MSRKLSLTLTAVVVAVSAGIASPAHALTAMYTPVSGAAFQPLNMVSPGVIRHFEGTVSNTSGSAVKVQASLGRSGGGANTFKVIGVNTGQNLTCTVFTRVGSGAPFAPVTVGTTIVGIFTLPITVNTPASGAVIFYSIECNLPGGASIHGVNTGNDRFFPVSGSGFVPSDNTSVPPQHEQGIIQNLSAQTVTVEASIGHANIAMNFDVRVVGNGGLITCKVIARRDTGVINFPQPNSGASISGFATLSMTAPAIGPAFYTMVCTLPPFANGQAAQIHGVSETGAAQNLFFPFAGNGFMPVNYLSPGASLVDGKLKNNTVSFIDTEVSLGHAQGGANGFLVYGRATGAGLSCTITVRSLNGVQSQWTNSFFGSGPYNFTVQANPASGTRYFYSMRCNVGPSTEIDGVRPDA